MNRFSALLLGLLCLLLLIPTAHALAQTPAPWQQAETARAALVAAQAAQLAQDQAEAQTQLHTAQTALEALAGQMQPFASKEAQTLRDVTTRLTLDSPASFAAARAQAWTTVLNGGMQTTLAAIAHDDPTAAQAWLRVRAFRKATRLTSASADATQALADWRTGKLTAQQAADAVRADLLDTYTANTRDALAAVGYAAKRQSATNAIEQAGLAAGYFTIVRDIYAQQRSTVQATQVATQFDQLVATTIATDWSATETQQSALLNALLGFTAAPLSADEIERKGQQVYQFINLLQIEYAKGIRNSIVTVPLEVQEAQTFHSQATALLSELTPALNTRDAQATSTLVEQMQQIGTLIASTGDPAEVAQRARTSMALLSDRLSVKSQGGDLVAVQALLRQLQTEVTSGDYATAESTRLQAYALFEIGAEQQLQTRDGQLGSEMEALFWQGTPEQQGLAVLVQEHAAPATFAPTIDRLQTTSTQAQSILSTQLTPTGVILAALAILVREGLEAVLVIGATLGYMRATQAPAVARRSVLGGAGIGVLLSFALWGLAQTILTVTPSNRELFEGVIALLAAAMLVYVTNWLLHKAYVVDWMTFVKQQVQQAMSRGSVLGLGLLGFMVVAREGFETVLFIQALAFDSPGWAVAVGVVLGLVFNLVVAIIILRFSVKLPLKPFFTITSVLLLILAVSFVGNGLRNLQEAGILGVNRLDGIPIGLIPSLFGLFPTVQTVVGQVLVVLLLAITFLIARARSQRTVAAQHTPTPAR